jgi:glycosyltransferase involved in cell wall biosynthesis
MERQAVQLASALRDRQYRIFFVTCAYWDWMKTERLSVKGTLDGFGVYRVPLFRKWRRLNAILYLFGALVFLVLSRARYAIIHAHELHSSGPIACLCKALMPSKKVVIKTTSAGEWVGDLANLGRLPAARWLRRLIARKADALVGVSPQVCRELTDAGFQRVQAIPNGVDTERFTPLDPVQRLALKRELLGERDGERVILYVGRLGLEKNLSVLLEATARLEVNSLLLIVGDGDLEQDLKRRSYELGIEHRVIFWGAAERVERFYQIADVFVLGSLTEGSPNALLEAMSTAVPCVGAAIPGITAVITDGVNGCLFQRGPAELAVKLTQVLSDQSLWSALSQAGRRHVLEQFSLDRTASAYVSLYEEMTGHMAIRGPARA